MNVIIDLANRFFKPILDMGAPIIMLIVLTVLALCFGVKFSKALEGGIKLAIALTGIGAIIGMLMVLSRLHLRNSLKIQEFNSILQTLVGHHWRRLHGVLLGRFTSYSLCSSLMS